ncbi:MAG: zinc dependent phospholipase C family protein [Flavobacteriales bacterium]|nr:zinc dependent phospholipase C family protein [Flavobacteriales bacterium]
MLNRILLRSVLVILLMVPLRSNMLFSWGFFAHKRINRLAVFTLPPEMIGLYKRNLNYITEHAVDPDKRRYVGKEEAPRHYIDIDHFGEGMDAFKQMPRKWTEAVQKYTEDTLKAYGIVPWHIDIMVFRLTKAFEEKDLDRILRYSADMGHYIADSHVPLHTTENYNGGMTNQKGIHGFWESRLPELFSDNYDFLVGRAEYIDDPLEFAWEIVEASHAAKDSVLDMERELNDEWNGGAQNESRDTCNWLHVVHELDKCRTTRFAIIIRQRSLAGRAGVDGRAGIGSEGFRWH